jgi:YggT family protein
LPQFLYLVVLRIVSLTIWFYIFTLLVYVALSWFAGGTYHPMMSVLSEIVAPILRPVRRLLPPISGMDLSPMIATILLIALSIALRTPF